MGSRCLPKFPSLDKDHGPCFIREASVGSSHLALKWQCQLLDLESTAFPATPRQSAESTGPCWSHAAYGSSGCWPGSIHLTSRSLEQTAEAWPAVCDMHAVSHAGRTARAPWPTSVGPHSGSPEGLESEPTLGVGRKGKGVCVCRACSFESGCPPLLSPVLSCPVQPGTSAICPTFLLSPRARLPFQLLCCLIEHTCHLPLGCVTSGADGFISGVWGPPSPRRRAHTGLQLLGPRVGEPGCPGAPRAWRLAAALHASLLDTWPGPGLGCPRRKADPCPSSLSSVHCPTPLPAPHLQRRWSF